MQHVTYVNAITKAPHPLARAGGGQGPGPVGPCRGDAAATIADRPGPPATVGLDAGDFPVEE
eukprot:7392186-Pyramimonas_sp.AAC.1